LYLDFGTSVELVKRGFTGRVRLLERLYRGRDFVANPTLLELLSKALVRRLGGKFERTYPPAVERIVVRMAELPYPLDPERAKESARTFFTILEELFSMSEPDSELTTDRKQIEATLVGSITLPPGVFASLEQLIRLEEVPVLEVQNLLVKLTPENKLKVIAALSPWRKYLAKVEQADLRLPEVPSRSHGLSYPFTLTKWAVGDPIEALVPACSPLGGRIVPGFVYRYVYRSTDYGYPDAFIIIDASGSMGNPFDFSPAVCGAIAVARAFLLAGSAVTAFSSSDEDLWATARTLGQAPRVYKVLAAAQRGALDRLDPMVVNHILRDIEDARTIGIVFTDQSVWESWVDGLRLVRDRLRQCHVFVLGKVPHHLLQLKSDKFHLHEITSKSWDELKEQIKSMLTMIN